MLFLLLLVRLFRRLRWDSSSSLVENRLSASANGKKARRVTFFKVTWMTGAEFYLFHCVENRSWNGNIGATHISRGNVRKTLKEKERWEGAEAEREEQHKREEENRGKEAEEEKRRGACRSRSRREEKAGKGSKREGRRYLHLGDSRYSLSRRLLRHASSSCRSQTLQLGHLSLRADGKVSLSSELRNRYLPRLLHLPLPLPHLKKMKTYYFREKDEE